MQIYLYHGQLISRNANPAGLKWQCYCNVAFLYADTLQGIKQLVKGALA